MKKFTFMLLAAFIAVTAMAGGPQKRLVTGQTIPAKVQLAQKLNLKQASREMLGKVQTSRARAPKKAVAAADLVGDYTWEYQQANESSTDLESLETTAGSAHVTIAESETGLTISGMFSNDLEATITSDEESGDWIVIAGGQVAGTSSYGDYVIYGMYYDEGDDENEAGWYFSDIYGQILEDGSIYFVDWMCRVLSGGDYDGYSLTPYFVKGSTLTPADPLAPITAPEGLETEEYSLTARNYKDDADVSGSVQIGFDGNDVYVQGFCTYLPEAWAKGTLAGTTITFTTGQYFGNYADVYDMFLNVLMGEDVVFDYDAEAGTLTAQNEFFLVDNSSYYFDSYRGAVLKKVIEKAAMPANPAITALQNGSYGWYFTFNVPTVDINGDGLATSKLCYMIYTDIEGEIAPLTFTPETHTKLTEAMTVFPYGFTENWDIYDNTIYLNELYSADWNNLGIQSIYYGGDETNATEIQWFHIKDYSGPSEATFNFNAMDVATSSNITTDGDITETVELTEGSVTLAISPKTESATTQNRFWGTSAGPQLRVYSGTLTFGVPEGYAITQIVFNAAKWNSGNTADSGAFDGTTWTGSAQTVVVTIAANTQINSIEVTAEGGSTDDGLVVLPAGVEPEEYTMYYEESDGNSAAKTVNVAVDGNDVYFQGMSEYLPEAWVKGTKDGNAVTFPAMQLMGEYSGYESYAFYGEDDVVFTYDAEADTYTAEGEIYGVLGEKYYDGRYFNPIIKKVADKAAMPADPEITAMKNGSYGWYIDFNVPAVDVNGEDLAIGKLAYMIYTDTQGEIAPLTFTPATHSKLTEDMTEIPYGFTENYDFYADEIYLNDLYSADWTRIGIQSIYYGGGEINATEIQWFDILPEPEPIEAPEGLETETYLFSAKVLVAGDEGEEDTWEEYSYQTQVGFDGQDVYFKGISDDTAEMWLEGTLSEDGKTVTIPANQYMGVISFWGYTFPYFFTAVAADGETMEDIVLNYDAEASTFTTDQTLVLHDGNRALGNPYQTFTEVVITKMADFAATPADPTFEKYDFEQSVGYNKIYASIPTVDVEGNALMTSKLFYTIWFEKDGTEQPYTFTAALYGNDFDEDVTEVPYSHDGYDIYSGGEIIYLEDEVEELQSWTKVGIQSIYYGGGERNESNIVWVETSTGIASIVENAKDAVIYNLAGQRVQKAQKGLFIVNGKKVAVK